MRKEEEEEAEDGEVHGGWVGGGAVVRWQWWVGGFDGWPLVGNGGVEDGQ